jgi:hypothetical protein
MISLLYRARLFFTRLLLPAIRLISKLGKPEPLCDYHDYQFIKSKIKPGDVLLSKEDWRLSNVLISGEWSHAAIAVESYMVLEATPPNVRRIHLAQFVLSKDHIALLRPKFKIDFKNYVDFYINGEYDFSFLSNNKQWYCSELVYDYLKRISNKMPFVLRKTWGVETSTPDDFINAKSKFDCIYKSKVFP